MTPSAMYYCTSHIDGTICYLAPEVLRGDDRHITTSADMWSLGAVLTYMANDGEHLFRSEKDVFNWRGDRSPMRRQFRYPELHQLILSLLSFNKHYRPTAQQVLQDQLEHPDRQEESTDQIDSIFDRLSQLQYVSQESSDTLELGESLNRAIMEEPSDDETAAMSEPSSSTPSTSDDKFRTLIDSVELSKWKQQNPNWRENGGTLEHLDSQEDSIIQ